MHQACLFGWLRRVASNPEDPEDPDDDWPVKGPVPDLPWEDLANNLLDRFRTAEAGSAWKGDPEADCEGDGDAGCQENVVANDVASIGEGWKLVDRPNPTDEVD